MDVPCNIKLWGPGIMSSNQTTKDTSVNSGEWDQSWITPVMSISSVAETQCKKQNAMHKINNIRHFLLNWAYRLVIGYGIYPSKPYFIIQCPESLQSPRHPHALVCQDQKVLETSQNLWNKRLEMNICIGKVTYWLWWIDWLCIRKSWHKSTETHHLMQDKTRKV